MKQRIIVTVALLLMLSQAYSQSLPLQKTENGKDSVFNLHTQR